MSEINPELLELVSEIMKEEVVSQNLDKLTKACFINLVNDTNNYKLLTTL